MLGGSLGEVSHVRDMNFSEEGKETHLSSYDHLTKARRLSYQAALEGIV